MSVADNGYGVRPADRPMSRADRQGGEAIPIEPAATVILLRPGMGRPEVLVVKRNDRLVFGPGHWVFPGGRLDPCDYGAGQDLDLWTAARHAAVREVREETRVRINAGALRPLSVWITPVGYPRRFRAHFFVCADAETGPVRVDGEEIVDYRWANAAAVLSACRAGSMPLMVPTRVTLERLANCSSLEECLSLCPVGEIEEYNG